MRPGRGLTFRSARPGSAPRSPAVPRLRKAEGQELGRPGRCRAPREPMGAQGGAGLAAAAGGARTAGMDGERLASGSSELAVGESPRGGAPIPGGSGSCSLLQADVLDLDEDEDDLEVFSKVRAGDVAANVEGAARPGKVPG